MLKIPVKLLGSLVKQGSKEVDVGNPVFIDTVNFVVEIGKAIISPF